MHEVVSRLANLCGVERLVTPVSAVVESESTRIRLGYDWLYVAFSMPGEG